MSEENESLHDEISALWKEAAEENPEVEVKEEVAEVKRPEVEPVKEPEAKGEPEVSLEVDPEKEEVKEPLLNQDKAPSGWGPKARERWSEIPEDLRGEILRREEASAKGVRQLQEEVAPMRSFVQTLSPFINEAVQNAQNPAEYIGRVMVTERVLRTGSPDQKFEALLGIADQYGLPLREIINKSVGEEVLKTPSQQQYQLPPEVQRELQEARQWRESQTQRSGEDELAKFIKTGPEFFEDVRNDMANLIEARIATDLQDAYDKACKLHPEISVILADRQGKKGKDDALKANQKRAAQSSVKSDESLGGKGKVDKSDKETSTEDDIRAAIAGLSGRD